jgi:NarL family two-component system sensor histidine kinase YdfH
MSLRTIAERGQLIYNEGMSNTPFLSGVQKVERDPNLFVWFLTFVVGGLTVWSFFENPALQQPLVAAGYFALVLLHIALHWLLGTIASQPGKQLWYVLVQGVLAFIISWMAGQIGVIFGLFMGLVGEAVGLFGLNRRALFSSAFYLTLAAVNASQIMDWAALGWTLIGIVPMVFFVVAYVTLYMRQIEAREQAQALLAELEAANRQLSEYAARVEDLTLANERQRMARELHDTLSQGLAGLILQLEAADAHLDKERPGRARQIVGETMEQARETLANARRAIGDLRSSAGAVPGLEQALEAEVQRFENRTGIPCELDLQLKEEPPDPVAETGLRIVSEALTNVARHAGASRAWVRVEASGAELCLEVRDDGLGFDPEAVDAGHYGLLGMRERARLVGGTLNAVSQGGQGTSIEACLPLSPDEVGHE